MQRGENWLLVQNGRKQWVTAEDLEAQLGFPLPIEELYWWVQGRADPDRPKQQASPENKSGFFQDDWLVEITSFNHTSLGRQLPHRVQVSRQIDDEPLQITLIIKSWLSAKGSPNDGIR